jgi:hypothetical protein
MSVSFLPGALLGVSGDLTDASGAVPGLSDISALDFPGVSGSWLPGWRMSISYMLGLQGVPAAVLDVADSMLGTLDAVPGILGILDVSGSCLPAWGISIRYVPGVRGTVPGTVPGMSGVSVSDIPGVSSPWLPAWGMSV